MGLKAVWSFLNVFVVPKNRRQTSKFDGYNFQLLLFKTKRNQSLRYVYKNYGEKNKAGMFHFFFPLGRMSVTLDEFASLAVVLTVSWFLNSL